MVNILYFILFIPLIIISCGQPSFQELIKEPGFKNCHININEEEKLKRSILMDMRSFIYIGYRDKKAFIRDRKEILENYFIKNRDEIIKIDNCDFLNENPRYSFRSFLPENYIDLEWYLLIAKIEDIQLKINRITLIRNKKIIEINTKGLDKKRYQNFEKYLYPNLYLFFKDGELNSEKVQEKALTKDDDITYEKWIQLGSKEKKPPEKKNKRNPKPSHPP